MTGSFWLDWAMLSVSLFDTILLLWLGLAVLLNAERRNWAIWLGGAALLTSAAFFISHTAILGHGSIYLSPGVEFWWRLGWLPVVASPFAWYLVNLWYAGYWEDRHTHLHRRQRPWFYFMGLFTLGLAGLLLLANPLPSYWQVAQLDLSASPSLAGIPLLLVAYPVYILLCIGLALDAQRRPGPSARVMGDLARRRARPWLMATSVLLLAVSLLVAWVMGWVVLNAYAYPAGTSRTSLAKPAAFEDPVSIAVTIGWFDLAIASLIGVSIILVGQAVVSYEVFTGKTLPRRGFFRHWRSAIILAAGYAALAAAGLTLQVRPVYSLLLSTLLITVFYALFSWRSFVERERAMAQLRPFVASQRLYDRLLAASAPSEVDAAAPFRALCQDVLGARRAYLAALGPLAPLVGPALAYPETVLPRPLPLAELGACFPDPETMCLPVDPARYGGACWAVPLWSERGLIGVLLLDEKRDGGLYTQEEIEIARASGERLIDTQASAEMARRLMALQRERLVESQVLDRRARRALHDDVLPQLHAAMLTLSGRASGPDPPDGQAVAWLADAHRRISDLLRDMPAAASPEVARLGLVGALRQAVADEFGAAFDRVTWQVEPEAEEAMCSLPSLVAEVLFYAAREALRNAARYGRGGDPSRPLHLAIRTGGRFPSVDGGGAGLELRIEDDGVGLSPDAGAEAGGHGLALHSTMLAVVGGSLSVESVPGAYTRVSLSLPLAVTSGSHDHELDTPTSHLSSPQK